MRKVTAICVATLLALNAADGAVLDEGSRISSFRKVVDGLDMGPATAKGGPQPWAHAYQIWGDSYVEFSIDLPETALYTFTLRAAIIPKGDGGALTELRLDQRPLPAGESFSRLILSESPRDYRWSSIAELGSHRIEISFMNRDENPRAPESLLIFSLAIEAVEVERERAAAALPAEPDGHRDPRAQPFSAYSLWNTPIGEAARWSHSADADTLDLHQPGALINAGEWSMPIYFSSAGQPARRFSTFDRTYPIPDTLLRPPEDAVPSAPKDGDRHMIVYSEDARTLYHFFGCSPVADGFLCGQAQIDDACGEAFGGYGWGSGVIRKWEIESGRIEHMLRYTLPAARTKAGDSWISGLAWPADRSDYRGPRGLYSGSVLYGSTIGIPADVDIGRLDLTPSGLALARALQDFGALQRDTGGERGLNFFAEPEAEGTRQLADMRADLAKIVPVLAILRNQGPSSINGGGKLRRSRPEGLDPQICPSKLRTRGLSSEAD